MTHPPGWWPDPTGRHQARYWDGARWSEHVANDGIGATDPVAVPDPPTPSAPVIREVGGEPGREPVRETSVTMATAGSPLRVESPLRWSPAPDPDPTDVYPRRVVAFLIDAAVCAAVALLLLVTLAPSYTRSELNRSFSCDEPQQFLHASSCDRPTTFQIGDTWYEVGAGDPGVPFAVFTFVYWAVAERLFGTTLGKRVLGLRVTTLAGRRVGLGRTTIRWALLFVDGPLTIFLCGLITSTTTNGHQRLGDLWSDSYVVDRKAAGEPLTLPE
jgi:uncharacterized RDD family membrane protein YckC